MGGGRAGVFLRAFWLRLPGPTCLALASAVRAYRSVMEVPEAQSLAARKAQLDQELAATQRELRLERQRQKDQRRRTWALTGYLKDAVVILYDLAGGTVAPAQLFLAKAARERQWPAKSDVDLAALIEDAYLAMDVDRLAGLVDLEGPTSPSVLKTCVRFYEEWRLAAWVRQLNQVQGVAPSTGLVLQRYEGTRAGWPEAVRPGSVGQASSVNARVWALRWRRRFGARHGRVRAREHVPVEEMRAKVTPCLKRGFGFGGLF